MWLCLLVSGVTSFSTKLLLIMIEFIWFYEFWSWNFILASYILLFLISLPLLLQEVIINRTTAFNNELWLFVCRFTLLSHKCVFISYFELPTRNNLGRMLKDRLSLRPRDNFCISTNLRWISSYNFLPLLPLMMFVWFWWRLLIMNWLMSTHHFV